MVRWQVAAAASRRFGPTLKCNTKSTAVYLGSLTILTMLIVLTWW